MLSPKPALRFFFAPCRFVYVPATSSLSTATAKLAGSSSFLRSCLRFAQRNPLHWLNLCVFSPKFGHEPLFVLLDHEECAHDGC